MPEPAPANDDDRDNPYIFERDVVFQRGRGETSLGRIDLYRRSAFVCEAKKIRPGTSKNAFDVALLNARNQAEGYARALSADEGRPPFLIVVDVGKTIQLYSEFSRTGGSYIEFPDPRSFSITLDQLAEPEIAERLRQVWLDPLSLDPAKRSAKVTREIADTLAKLAKSLEAAKHDPAVVAQFLMRCLFTMFSEDVGLLPIMSFTRLLERLSPEPRKMPAALEQLWADMDTGGFSGLLFEKLPRFNGKLFKERHAVPLDRDQIDLLILAAKADWRDVEPAIFGTLLERALNVDERHRLGAHYTPRAYVERLVLPTVIEPLRERWQDVQTAAVNLAQGGKVKEAAAELKQFHYQLTQIKVLDPACGTGNFLYVTLEHLKRLEGEVLNMLANLGQTEAMSGEGFGVDPHQLLGIEINPRAAAIAEVVLWIGYLQWHYRTRGDVRPAEPIVRDFGNIENRDAVLAFDAVELQRDAAGKPLSRWDGKSFKVHPVTGKNVPDESRQVAIERYINPRAASWPEADYVVGNPPFIGAANVRRALGDGYADALRASWKQVPESADFVMHWWDRAAELVRLGKLQRFGLITTNSLRQTFNRRVIERHLQAKPALSLSFAIADHPWVDSSDGAAVRIAMSCGVAGDATGLLQTVLVERETGDGEISVELKAIYSKLHADLTAGSDVSSSLALRSNSDLSSRGIQLSGAGFLVDAVKAEELLAQSKIANDRIRPYRNGRDLTESPRGLLLIDLFGLELEELRAKFSALYQHVVLTVKPERDQNKRQAVRERWWIHGEARAVMRSQLYGLPRYIATVETAKHRTFQFLDASILPDNKIVAIAIARSEQLACFSSRIHVAWSMRAGSWLGVGNDSVYVKTRCFETFPFPALASPILGDSEQPNKTLVEKLRSLGEQLDAHRKRQQAAHTGLTLTGMYNVLEKLKSAEPLTDKEKIIHEQGLVSVLKSLHDEIDLAVLEAYGWGDLAGLMQLVNGNDQSAGLDRSDAIRQLDETLLERLVALNKDRAAEESRGLIRYLRPEFQNPALAAAAPKQAEMDVESDDDAPAAKPINKEKIAWPKTLPEQVRAVLDVLKTDGTHSSAALVGRFKGVKAPKLGELLQTLVDMGRIRETKVGFSA